MKPPGATNMYSRLGHIKYPSPTTTLDSFLAPSEILEILLLCFMLIVIFSDLHVLHQNSYSYIFERVVVLDDMKFD